MKIALALTMLTACLMTGCAANDAHVSNPHRGDLRHVVLFKFKDTATPQQVQAIEEHFARLRHEIPQIIAYEWGTNNSPEGLDDGLTHAFLVTFADEAGRDAYLPHPAHKRFVDELLPILDKAVVVDYIAR